MSDPNQDYQPPPPPPMPTEEPKAPRPTKLRLPAIVLAVFGVLVAIAGIAKFLPGGIGTGLAFLFFGIVLFALSFIRLPEVGADAEPPMGAGAKLAGIFFEPTRVFRNLRSHPTWLAPFIIITLAVSVYEIAFFQRLTPDRIVEFTMEKLQDSPIKPPPEAMEKAKEDALQQAKQPIQRVQTTLKHFVGSFVLGAIAAAFYMLAVLIFGGRINFWQSLAVMFYASLPVILVQKLVSLIILFIKDPDSIHPVLGQETLLQDNLGVLFTPGEHPALYVLGTAIGVLSLYGIWLRATGLRHGGTKVSSTAAWGATLSILVLGLILGMIFATVFSSFIS